MDSAFSAVIRTINSVTVGNAALTVALAGANPDNAGILRVKNDAANRIRAFVIKDWRPGRDEHGRDDQCGAGSGRTGPAGRGDRRHNRQGGPPLADHHRPKHVQASIRLSAGDWSSTLTPQTVGDRIGIGLVQPGKRREFKLPVELPPNVSKVQASLELTAIRPR